jgi:uncharacterized sulfatase
MTRTILPLFVLFASLPAFSQNAPPPNVLLIIGDDHHWGDFGFMGHKHVRTPNIDKLASQSATFVNGYTPTSLCRASLASIVTGQYPRRHRITSNDPPEGVKREAMLHFIKAAPALPRLLAEKGYRSLQTGKWWEGHYSNGGFTDGMTTKGRHGEEGLAIGRQTMQPIYNFLAASDKRQPWFAWYAPMMPHMPHNPPPRLVRHYLDQKLDERVAKYYAMCEWFDETVGQLLDHLDKNDLSQNTLVVFVVDNGWLQPTTTQPQSGARGLPGGKNSPYDAGLRTPILLRWPGGRIKPARHEHLVCTIDLAPTILSSCGVKPPATINGISLLGVATAESAKLEREAVHGELFVHTANTLDDPAANLTHRWIRQGDWKLILPVAGDAGPELYDLRTDPHEKKNLAPAQPATVTRLREMLPQFPPAPPPR